MDDKVELLWRYLKENLEHSRHHETLRATATNIIVSVSGASFAIVAWDRCLNAGDLPLLAFLVILGGFGALFSAKQWERASFHNQRARTLRDEIDRSPVAPGFRELRHQADAVHNEQHPWLSRRELHSFWIALHLSISALALVLATLANFNPQCAS